MKNFIKKYPLSLTVIAIIWCLCFMSVPETPLEEVPFIDKWVHICMYIGLGGIIWIEYLRSHRVFNLKTILLGGLLFPIIMSGVIELGQAYCTNGRRSGDWMDFAANSLGACIATLIGYYILRKFVKAKK